MTDSNGETPYTRLQDIAQQEGLLGSDTPTGVDFAGTENRISYSRALEIRQLLKQRFSPSRYQEVSYFDLLKENQLQERFKLSEQEKEEAAELIVEGLRLLGTGELSGAKLGEFTTLLDFITYGYWETQEEKNVHVSCGDRDLVNLSFIAHKLAYSVALLEKNLPPNDLGYIPDAALSFVRIDQVVVENAADAYLHIDSYAKDMYQELPDYYNAIIARILPNRPTFMDRPVSSAVIQTFPQLQES